MLICTPGVAARSCEQAVVLALPPALWPVVVFALTYVDAETSGMFEAHAQSQSCSDDSYISAAAWQEAFALPRRLVAEHTGL